MSGAIKINGTSSGSTTITAPASGADETIELSTALAAKMDSIVSGTALLATSQATTSVTYTDLATVGPSVTLTTGTKALIFFGAHMYGSTTNSMFCSVAISGATTIAASDSWAVQHDSSLAGYGGTRARAYLVTGLTAGSNTFTLKYRASSATATFANRYIIVMDMGS